MTKISATVTCAHLASALGIERILVLGEAQVLDVHAALRREQETVTRGTRRQNAIHHVHAHGGVLCDLVGIPHPQPVPGLVLGKAFERATDLLFRLPPRLAYA